MRITGIHSVVMLSDKLPRESLNTAEFCEFFNNLFDIFNFKGLSSYSCIMNIINYTQLHIYRNIYIYILNNIVLYNFNLKYYCNQYKICIFFITGIHRNHYKSALQKNTKSEEFLLSAVSILDSIRYKSDYI